MKIEVRTKIRMVASFIGGMALVGCGVLAVGQGKGAGKPAMPAAVMLQAAPGDASKIVLESCRPRLFFRPTAWSGGQ